jgi:hypothetical protein
VLAQKGRDLALTGLALAARFPGHGLAAASERRRRRGSRLPIFGIRTPSRAARDSGGSSHSTGSGLLGRKELMTDQMKARCSGGIRRFRHRFSRPGATPSA